EVHPRADPVVAGDGPGEARADHVDREAVRLERGDREAGAVHGDRIPERELGRHGPAPDPEAARGGPVLDAPDLPDVLHDPGEHHAPSRSYTRRASGPNSSGGAAGRARRQSRAPASAVKAGSPSPPSVRGATKR